MPINKKMMSSIKKEYGVKKGEKIYYAVENKMKNEGKTISTNKSKQAKKK